MRIKIILLAGLLGFFSCNALNPQGKTEVVSTEVASMLEKSNAFILLDVRTPEEFAQGHLQGAVNWNLQAPGTLDSINTFDKNAQYIVYCRTKNRSNIVVNSMLRNGFKTVYQMMDGIAGWNQNGLPLAKD